MEGVNRTRNVNRCPDCKQILQENDGALKCACENQVWHYERAERGTEAEERYLADNGFEFTRDAGGDLYYVGPFCHIIHLYAGNEWESDKAPEDCVTLEEYFTLTRPIFGPTWPIGVSALVPSAERAKSPLQDIG
jgi:hypothetical protein